MLTYSVLYTYQFFENYYRFLYEGLDFFGERYYTCIFCELFKYEQPIARAMMKNEKTKSAAVDSERITLVLRIFSLKVSKMWNKSPKQVAGIKNVEIFNTTMVVK